MHMANDNAGKSIQKWASMFLGGPYPEDRYMRFAPCHKRSWRKALHANTIESNESGSGYSTMQ